MAKRIKFYALNAKKYGIGGVTPHVLGKRCKEERRAMRRRNGRRLKIFQTTTILFEEFKMTDKIQNEIEALKRLAATVPDDALAQASIAGQINALAWASDFQTQD